MIKKIYELQEMMSGIKFKLFELSVYDLQDEAVDTVVEPDTFNALDTFDFIVEGSNKSLPAKIIGAT